MKVVWLSFFIMATALATDDVVSTITLLVEEDINAIKGHCSSMNDSKVFNYVVREINKKIATIPGFGDEGRHYFELQQLMTDTRNYNEIYKTLCANGVQSDIFNALIIANSVVTAYTPLREQALNVVVYQLQTIVNYQQ